MRARPRTRQPAAVTLVAVAGVLAACGGGASSRTTSAPRPSSTTTAASSQPAALVRAALARARGERSLRYRATTTYSANGAHLSLTVSGQVTGSQGVQTITERFPTGSGHVTVELLGGVAYFKGDVQGLEHYMNFPATAARRDAGRWISVRRTAGTVYREVSAALTLRSAVSEILIGAPFSSAVPVDAASGVATVTGKLTGQLPSGVSSESATLKISRRGHGLPVSYRARVVGSGRSEEVVSVFEDWGRPVVLPAAPSGALAYSAAG